MKFSGLMILVTIFISSCAPAGLMATEPVVKVSVGGVSHDVQAMPDTKNGWAANKSDLWGGPLDPNDYAENIKAIEKHTGCKVDRGTVLNQGMRTIAAVRC